MSMMTAVAESSPKRRKVFAPPPLVSAVTNGKAPAQEALEAPARIYEYTSAANPDMPEIPHLAHPPELHQSGPTRSIPFDLSKAIGTEYQATSPNLLAGYLRICEGESLNTEATATSQSFYAIRGAGRSESEHGVIHFSEGDLFVLPATSAAVTTFATADTAIYWVTDEPLLKYLGVTPNTKKFKPTLFTRQRLLAEVERVAHEPNMEHRNRMGILLGNDITDKNTKTLTHTLWSLLNVLPPRDAQRPHRHNSVALDLCVSAESEGVYTLMGPELGPDGWVKNPIKLPWKTGAVFVTPPGWWHSHHNDTDEPAWVLPIQDAGLYTHQRTLDIQFAPPLKNGGVANSSVATANGIMTATTNGTK